MLRRLAPFLLAIPLLINNCSGPSKLTEKSEEKLAGGDAWRAWQLATRALDKEPGNPRSRAAATAAGAAIAQDWQRRIHALAEVDSLKAAAQVLELTDFREHAARYATIQVGAEWPAEERALRNTAARIHFQGSRLHSLSYRPFSDHAEIAARAVAMALAVDLVDRRALNPALKDEPDLKVAAGAAYGESLATMSGSRGDSAFSTEAANPPLPLAGPLVVSSARGRGFSERASACLSRRERGPMADRA